MKASPRCLDGTLFSRFQSFCGICLFVSVAGCTYAYGVLSPLLQTKLLYTQDEIDLIASIGNTGLYMSFFAGMVVEQVGFYVVVVFGGFLVFLGYTYISLSICNLTPTSVYLVACFYFLAQVGVCCHISSAVTVVVKIFPGEARGATIGLVKSYFALSSATLATLAGGGLFAGSQPTSTFLLFVAIFVPIVGECCCFYLYFLCT